MSVIGHSPLAGASGAAGGDSGPLYVDDVFSTFLYTGTGSTITVNNGIDISGKGGLVWTKSRNNTDNGYGDNFHRLTDTEAQELLSTNSTAAGTTSGYQRTFNSNGFTDSYGWSSGNEIVSWTFRKATGFFDVVTYNGTGSAQNISHSLGSVPGMIMIHCLDGTHDWEVYHRSTGATKSFHLNSDDAQTTDSTVWNNTTPTSTVFTVGTSSNVNQNGHGYVAYVFAHDDQSFGTDSDEAIIKCGSYTGNGTAGQEVNLGFEPQFVLLKGANTASTTWWMFDVMRGMVVDGVDERLRANANTQSLPLSTYGANLIKPTPTGFALETTSGEANDNGTLFVYMAIRRPHKPPTAGTEVFAIDTLGGNSPTPPGYYAGFSVDMGWSMETTTSNQTAATRLTDGRRLHINLNNAEDSNSPFKFDYQSGWLDVNAVTTDYVSWMFRRAPGFFDVVTADYPGISQAIPHNLGVAPELIINKPRDGAIGWMVGSDYLQNTNGWNRYFELNSSGYEGGTSTVWNQTAPTATHFTLGSYPGSSYKGIFYLFASLDGVSKVGSYSGTGSNVNVDCGFTSGARFILIKRTDNTGDWYVWDTLRGIVSGNDPYKRINLTAAQVTNTDYVDPLNAGFTVTSSAPAALNASGGTYLFLAIA